MLLGTREYFPKIGLEHRLSRNSLTLIIRECCCNSTSEGKISLVIQYYSIISMIYYSIALIYFCNLSRLSIDVLKRNSSRNVVIKLWPTKY